MGDSPAPADTEGWSVKEYVADLKKDMRGRFDSQDVLLHEINTKMDTKAEKADVAALTVKRDAQLACIGTTLNNHGTRIATLEHHHNTGRRTWAVIGAIAGTLLTVAAIIAAAVIH